jgi:serine/threonine protein phosphatase PrpC
VPSTAKRNPGAFIKLSVPHRSRNEVARITAAGGVVVNNRAFGVLEPSRSIGDIDVKGYCAGAVIAEPHFTELVLPSPDVTTPFTTKLDTVEMLETPQRSGVMSAWMTPATSPKRRSSSSTTTAQSVPASPSMHGCMTPSKPGLFRSQSVQTTSTTATAAAAVPRNRVPSFRTRAPLSSFGTDTTTAATTATPKHDAPFLILASDGLWDVLDHTQVSLKKQTDITSPIFK